MEIICYLCCSCCIGLNLTATTSYIIYYLSFCSWIFPLQISPNKSSYNLNLLFLSVSLLAFGMLSKGSIYLLRLSFSFPIRRKVRKGQESKINIFSLQVGPLNSLTLDQPQIYIKKFISVSIGNNMMESLPLQLKELCLW